ncbi:helix-turn-helix domain-containing protein [Burkholderia sp. Ac-20353]|uniref:helix-turn-helix domain-containing protein n=1 Tax=Burkholderia sp. Ac-20353 TaxID=2703894 RepID=UPI001F12179E|nr:helix-turn-helix domain-containing protein [Burkholderia sp. Ac-20353]MBN3788295.1 helix-turn-helix domain-containing protein [Burkholderia sp. Ac-20353]
MHTAQSTPHFGASLAARGIEPTLTTEDAAAALNRQPQTLRKWACLENGPIRPIRVHRRLAWKVSDIQKLLNGEAV